MLRALLEHAEVCFEELEGESTDAFVDLREFLFTDTDDEFMFDLSFDGIDDPETYEGAQLGTGPLEELRPGDLGSLRGWINDVGFEDLPHGRRSDLMAETCEFAVDAAVAPSRVLGGEAEDESADLVEVGGLPGPRVVCVQ